MKIWRADAETIAISGFNPLVCELLRRIGPSAAPGEDRAVLDRLYSSPTRGQEPEFDSDWQSLVAPDLKELFRSSLDVIQADLAAVQRDDLSPDEILHLPFAHLEPWINGLNQARLAIATRHSFTEADMEMIPPEGDPRALPLFQIHFYGLLQDRFIQELVG